MMKLLVILISVTLSIASVAGDKVPAQILFYGDGDTFNVLLGGEKETIRFNAVDCPESDQPWGSEAASFVQEVTRGKSIKIESLKRGRYEGAFGKKRIIGVVYAGQSNINLELVKKGHCWVNTKYTSDPEYLAAFQEAQNNLLGLWALPQSQRIPPWEWRRRFR